MSRLQRKSRCLLRPCSTGAVVGLDQPGEGVFEVNSSMCLLLEALSEPLTLAELLEIVAKAVAEADSDLLRHEVETGLKQLRGLGLVVPTEVDSAP